MYIYILSSLVSLVLSLSLSLPPYLQGQRDAARVLPASNDPHHLALRHELRHERPGRVQLLSGSYQLQTPSEKSPWNRGSSFTGTVEELLEVHSAQTHR